MGRIAQAQQQKQQHFDVEDVAKSWDNVQWVQQYRPAVKAVLPKSLDLDRFMRIVLTEVKKNYKLKTCDPKTLVGAIMQAAQCGLEIGGALGQAYLVPYKGEAVLQIGYKGMIQLCRRSGDIALIKAQTVFENDEFEYSLGLNPDLKHVPAKGERGQPVAYYAFYKTKDGFVDFEVMTHEEVLKHAHKFSATSHGGVFSSSSPWAKDFNAMAMKGLALDTPIPTPEGWSTMGDLKAGDKVFDLNGSPTKIVAVSEIKNIDCYKITFSDGDSVICDHEHRWPSEIGKNARRNVRNRGWSVYNIEQLYKAKNNGENVIVPVTPSLNCSYKSLGVDPYTLGYWLGNGHSYNAGFTCSQDDVYEITSYISEAYEIGSIRKDKRSKAVDFGVRSKLKTKLRNIGVLQNKHIPSNYLRSSFNQRLELLRGLIDSDGCLSKDRGRVIYSSTNKILANDVFELVLSLGQQAHMSNINAKGYGKEVVSYNVEFLPNGIIPCKLERKKKNIRDRQVIPYRSVKKIEKVESVPTKCISVDSETHCFLAGKHMIPTHNTVLKKVLKYAPMATDFQHAMTADEAVSSIEISQETTELPSLDTVEIQQIGMEDDEDEQPIEINGEAGEIIEGEVIQTNA